MGREAVYAEGVPKGQVIPAREQQSEKSPGQADSVQHLPKPLVWAYGVGGDKKDIYAAKVQREKRRPKLPAMNGYAILEQLIAYQQHRQRPEAEPFFALVPFAV